MRQMKIKWWDSAQMDFAGIREGKMGPKFTRYLWFADRLPPLPASVLEIGCSSGEALAQIADKGYECYAVDFPNIIAKIDKHPKIKYIGMNVDGPDGTAWKKEWAEKFDVIIIAEVLQHVIFDENVLYACWHYLKPDGRLLLSTENTRLVSGAIHAYPTEILKRMLTVLNFKIIEYTTRGLQDYIWVYATKEVEYDGSAKIP